MDSIKLARSNGQRLLTAGHPSAPDIQQALTGLDQELNSLEAAWQKHQLQLQQALELQVGSLHPAPTTEACTNPTAPGQSQRQRAGVPGAFPSTHCSAVHYKSCLLWSQT